MSDLMQGSHITKAEYACHHCGALPIGFFDDEGELGPEYTILFQAFEKIRSGRGDKPLAVISGYRCLGHEKALFLASIQPGTGIAAKAFMSVHPFGLALDLRGEDTADQEKIVRLARALSPVPRIGWKSYRKAGQTTVHIDYGYLIEPRYSEALVPGMEW